MGKAVINNYVMKGKHAYEHAMNVGDICESLPETDNLNDAKAIALRSASNGSHWTCSCKFVQLSIGPLRPLSFRASSKSRQYCSTSHFK